MKSDDPPSRPSQGPRLNFKSSGTKLQYTVHKIFGILTLYIAGKSYLGKKIRIVRDNQVCLNNSNITNPMKKYLHLQTFHRRPYRLLQEL